MVRLCVILLFSSHDWISYNNLLHLHYTKYFISRKIKTWTERPYIHDVVQSVRAEEGEQMKFILYSLPLRDKDGLCLPFKSFQFTFRLKFSSGQLFIRVPFPLYPPSTWITGSGSELGWPGSYTQHTTQVSYRQGFEGTFLLVNRLTRTEQIRLTQDQEASCWESGPDAVSPCIPHPTWLWTE